MKKCSYAEAKEKFEARHQEWKLINFIAQDSPCTIQHKCGYLLDYTRFNNPFNQKPRCPKCDADQKWKYNIGDIVDNLQIVGKKVIQQKNGTFGSASRHYQYKCLKCGFDCRKKYYDNGELFNEYWVPEDGLAFRNNRCVCCNHHAVQPGINDVATTNPEVVQYFLDKNQANMFSRGSDKKVKRVCPICGTIQPTEASINSLVRLRNMCIKCGTYISYPEKLMFFILKSLNVNFQMHKFFDWSKHIYNAKNETYGDKEYDFYLVDYNVIIETHGAQHYKESIFFNKQIKRLKEEQENDRIKKKIAEDNNVKYIAIDCSKSDVNFIRKNIENSELSSILNIQNVDWKQCNKDALYGIKALALQDKKNFPDISRDELSEKYGVSKYTIYRWLKNNADICNYNKEEEILRALPKNPVYSPELDMYFESGRVASDYVGINQHTLYSCLNGHNQHAGKHPITGERLSWIRISKEEFINFKKNK